MKSVADAFTGLFLFLSNWLSPNSKMGELVIESVVKNESHYVIHCEQKFRWGDDATAIIDAGIPMSISFMAYEETDTIRCYTRTLHSPLESELYFVSDSLDSVELQQESFQNVYLAVKFYKNVHVTIPLEKKGITIEGTLLPSPVSELDTTISLAPLCGGDTFVKSIFLKEVE